MGSSTRTFSSSFFFYDNIFNACSVLQCYFVSFHSPSLFFIVSVFYCFVITDEARTDPSYRRRSENNGTPQSADDVVRFVLDLKRSAKQRPKYGSSIRPPIAEMGIRTSPFPLNEETWILLPKTGKQPTNHDVTKLTSGRSTRATNSTRNLSLFSSRP